MDMIINTRLITLGNILFIFVVALIAHHFAKGWFKNSTAATA